MKLIRNILIIALALLVQSTVFGRVSILGIKPDLAMLVLILLVSISTQVECIMYGFIIGFLQDVYTPEFLGANAFVMSLMGFVLDTVKERLTVENYSVKTVVAFTACVFHDVIFLSFYTRFDFAMMKDLFITESLFGAVFTSGLLFIILLLWEFVISGGFNYVIRELFGSRR